MRSRKQQRKELLNAIGLRRCRLSGRDGDVARLRRGCRAISQRFREDEPERELVERRSNAVEVRSDLGERPSDPVQRRIKAREDGLRQHRRGRV